MALNKYLSSKCIKIPVYANTLPIFSQSPTCEITEEDQTTGKWGVQIIRKGELLSKYDRMS